MDRVWAWVERSDGQIEQHIGPFERGLRDKDGKRLTDQHGNPLWDTAFADDVMKVVGGFHKQNAYDVASGMSDKDVQRDTTGALRSVALALVDISARVIARQNRAESRQMVDAGGRPMIGHPPLRAMWLADIELANMKVHVRGE